MVVSEDLGCLQREHISNMEDDERKVFVHANHWYEL